ncbi:MAG: hypothetical protein ACK41E_03710 [Deinococcales bacterium]
MKEQVKKIQRANGLETEFEPTWILLAGRIIGLSELWCNANHVLAADIIKRFAFQIQ